MEAFRILFNTQYKNEKILENTSKKKLKYKSSWYMKHFIKNYELYYKNGGQQKNIYNDNLYERLTGNAPLEPDIKKKRKSGKKRK
jgi:hypothetical protein